MSEAVEGVALAACPFCGGSQVRVVTNTQAAMSWVSCPSCGLEAPSETGVSAEQAVTYWNTRTTPPARSYADGVADVVNLCRQWSEPGAKVLSSMSGLTDAEHAIAQRTAEGIAEAASGLLSQGGKA